jgi:hypothetical protein
MPTHQLTVWGRKDNPEFLQRTAAPRNTSCPFFVLPKTLGRRQKLATVTSTYLRASSRETRRVFPSHMLTGLLRAPRLPMLENASDGVDLAASQLVRCFCLTALRSKKSAWLTSADTIARW